MDQILAKAHQIGIQQVGAEFKEALRIVQQLQPKNFLEIGTYLGGTFYAWSQYASGKKISIDKPYEGQDYLTGEKLARHDAKIKSLVLGAIMIYADSHDPVTVSKLKEILNGESLDFLFVDGDHNGAKRDYDDYQGFVKNGGIIMFHDIDGPVQNDWKLISQTNLKIKTITNNTGLGGFGIIFK